MAARNSSISRSNSKAVMSQRFRSAGCNHVRHFALVAVALLVTACDPNIIYECKATESVTVFCGMEKPEDIASLGDSDWLLISEMGSLLDQSKPGSIVALNTVTGRIVRVGSNSTPARDQAGIQGKNQNKCGPPPELLKPRGLDVIQTGQDSFQLLFVNGAEGQRIERYAVSVEENLPQLTWEGCVSIPDTYLVNDVAAFSNGSFVASHMFELPRSSMMTAKLFLGMNTGYALFWSAQGGWEKVAGSDVSLANGIAVEEATDTVFLASTYGESVTAISLKNGDKRSVDLPIQPDNITWSGTDRLLAVGHNGIPLLGTSGCREVSPTPCSFDFEVVEIDTNNLTARTIYRDDSGLIPGPATAFHYRDGLYFGTAFGDRVSRIPMPSSEAAGVSH
jgi:hypothetical protein